MTIYEKNYKSLDELGIVGNLKNYTYFKMNARGLMDLSVDKLSEDDQKIIFSMAHFGELNGDLMADPDMELLLTKETNEVQALSYRNDYAGYYREVYDNYNDPTSVNEELQRESNRFLSQWLGNLKAGGYFVNKIEE